MSNDYSLNITNDISTLSFLSVNLFNYLIWISQINTVSKYFGLSILGEIIEYR